MRKDKMREWTTIENESENEMSIYCDVMQLRSQILSVTNCLCNQVHWRESFKRIVCDLLFVFTLHQHVVVGAGAHTQTQ